MYNTDDLQTYNYYNPYGNFLILLMLILVEKQLLSLALALSN